MTPTSKPCPPACKISKTRSSLSHSSQTALLSFRCLVHAQRRRIRLGSSQQACSTTSSILLASRLCSEVHVLFLCPASLVLLKMQQPSMTRCLLGDTNWTPARPRATVQLELLWAFQALVLCSLVSELVGVVSTIPAYAWALT